MKKIIYLISILLVRCFFISASEPVQSQYLNQNLDIKVRVNDLVSKLTLQEKVDLMRYNSPAIERLNIKAYNWWNESLHGVARSGLATVFPQAIGMAATWDVELMGQIGTAISDEARAKYHDYLRRGKSGIYKGLTFWSPNINIFRDPRWGRGMETYGEDPVLTASLAIPYIKGLQGNDTRYFKTIACAKHFAVHSGPESTRHSFDVLPTKYDLADTYLPHFKQVIQESNVQSVMCAYQRFNGMPCCGNKYLSGLLRNRWGFNGHIVSDCWAIVDFYSKEAHHVVETPEAAAAMAVKAGTDLNCGSTYPYLVNAVKQGLITEDEINISVARLLTTRMQLGEFDNLEKQKYAQIPYSVVDSKAHQDLALEAAHKSIVLLKNEANLLPLSKSTKKIAVIGPNANNINVLLGNYHGYPSNPITPLAGIKSKFPNAEIAFAQGCDLADELPTFEPISSDCLFTDSTLNKKGLRATYYSTIKNSGSPEISKIDTLIDFGLYSKQKLLTLPADTFSISWEGVLEPTIGGDYALAVDGMTAYKLFVNDTLLFNWESEHHSRKEYVSKKLIAGQKYKLRLEFVQKNCETPFVQLLWSKPNRNLLAQALRVAKDADVSICFMGLSPELEGEEMKVKVPGFTGGDRIDLNLPITQTNLLKELSKLGKPIILVLLNGSAISINWEKENIPAIIEAWYPGQAGGAAIADILVGDYNPTGKLPITFYKSVNELPAFDDYNMQGRTYRYMNQEPLYTFGYGLNYTKFSFKINQNEIKDIKIGKDIILPVLIKNNSLKAGEELIQLYISHSKDAKSHYALKQFKKIKLKAGQSLKYRFRITKSDYAITNEDGKKILIPGKLNIKVTDGCDNVPINSSESLKSKQYNLYGKTEILSEIE
ncbi:MAG: glycoside hydrolase family 3 C-terminal domain-containing protein [Paludibacter sp.]|nr:glycoside hydrolase family 3 C-terminal domain-containing protein [Paludibacter sp.]